MNIERSKSPHPNPGDGFLNLVIYERRAEIVRHLRSSISNAAPVHLAIFEVLLLCPRESTLAE